MNAASELTGNALVVTRPGGVEVLEVQDRVAPVPGSDEVLVEVTAAGVNFIDVYQREGVYHTPTPFVAGNEGAGTVVAAGPSEAAQALMGRTVTFASGRLYRTHARTKAANVVPLPAGAPAHEGASLFVNPMTAQGFLNTMRAEGHSALVHTAAASNLGQMLAKLCLKEAVPLVAIVRSDAQKEILTGIGLTHVLDSSTDGFVADLVDALAETGATLGFDAIGGGRMADRILTAMERAQAKRGVEFSTYGSPVHKQVYIYGRLDTGETILTPGYGMYWGVGGWLLSPHLETLDRDRVMEMRRFAVEERNGIFASHYTQTISLDGMIDPDIARAYQRKATGEKYLVDPSR